MVDLSGLWKAPGSGTPASPGDVAVPTAEDIANRVAAQLIVPRGPLRTIAYTLGVMAGATNGSYAIIANALNAAIASPILGGPGIITSGDFNAQIVATGAASGIFELFDGDSSMPLLRRWILCVGAAGTYSIAYSIGAPELPFLNGIFARWTPITLGFGGSIINVNIDYRSIPIGQRD